MYLFRPLTVGQARLPNRIAMTALPSDCAAVDGFANQSLTAYYSERAQGGTGLIVLEAALPLPPGDAPAPHLGLYADAYVPNLRDCISTIRSYGPAVFVMVDQIIPVLDMSPAELHTIAEAWTAAAWRVRAAGADGMMLSCADGGPFDQLLSPSANQRNDQYGGDMSRRLRLLLDIVERVSAWMGKRLVIGLRLNIGEFTPGGLTLQDARVIAKRLVGAGITLLEVSIEVSADVPVARFPGWRVPLAAGIKAVVDIPVMVGGLLADAELADSVIRDGSVDLVALGESLRAEPRWPQYALAALAEHKRQNGARPADT